MITVAFTQTFETVITLIYNLPLYYYYFHKLYGLHIIIKLLIIYFVVCHSPILTVKINNALEFTPEEDQINT